MDHTPIVKSRRMRPDQVTGFNLTWHEVPLKRMIDMKRRWPQTAQEIVTFTSQEVADAATEFMDLANVQYDQVSYAPFKRWIDSLKFQPDLQAVYDSDPDRLAKYGQLGKSVQKGWDF